MQSIIILMSCQAFSSGLFDASGLNNTIATVSHRPLEEVRSEMIGLKKLFTIAIAILPDGTKSITAKIYILIILLWPRILRFSVHYWEDELFG